ncbi:hypothetical protein AKJ16_DCAP21947 [Drosera capensis]
MATLLEIEQIMLKDKSLAPGAHVYFNSSSTEWISSTIEALLHKARIVHLNEAEMYFGEMSVDPPAEFYCPRNELQALNHIVSLIDTSIENYMHETTACLQKLHDEVIKRIHEFGQKYSSCPMILEKSCDKEKDLLQWARSNGSECKLQIAFSCLGEDRGCIC